MDAFDDNVFNNLSDELLKVTISTDIHYKTCDICTCEMN